MLHTARKQKLRVENDADAAAENTNPNQHVAELERYQGAGMGATLALFRPGSSDLRLQSIRVKH